MADRDVASLIRRACAGEPEAFDAIIDAYGKRLHGYLYRLCGSRDDADDLLQEVFLRVVRTIGSYSHDGRFEGWLFRIATNLARDRIRRVKRSPKTLSLDAPAGGDADRQAESWETEDENVPGPDAAMQSGEEADLIQQALGQLPDAEREVIMLRHFSQLSFAEIAESMETPLGTALARAHRGLAKMREWMQPRLVEER